MHINFPATGTPTATGIPATGSAAPAAKASDATPAAQASSVTMSGADASTISAAEAALKASTETSGRIDEIRQAIASGLIRFDAEALAANILRYHGKQD
ncbi:flagellar biosynthesis anti-sigma factor FlgM [Xanthomonas campestris pv. phormiicola]|nr:flagellar biosynthesis anti-sigma factor FlgM [Xanthomonas campestris pv. phormiicola]UYC17864.1 flagellar biosynthesis anti-sigma factor FlgM [Xanthomonas campestris pv. phormiicola]